MSSREQAAIIAERAAQGAAERLETIEVKVDQILALLSGQKPKPVGEAVLQPAARTPAAKAESAPPGESKSR